METGIKRAWKGKCIWNKLKRKLHINYDKVVIALTEDDEEWNRYALLYLKTYIKRKSAECAVVLHSENVAEEFIKKYAPERTVIFSVTKDDIIYLNSYYCLYNFFYNFVFFGLNYPKDNNSEQILADGVSKKELICLGFYYFRNIPDIEREI